MTPPLSLSGTTAIAGVLGHPVHHSLSPVMQNAALCEMGLNWVFLALPAPAEQLATVVQGLEAESFLILPHEIVRTYMQRKTADYDRWLGGMRRLRGKVLGRA